jgi:hypothetical protein
MNEFSKTTENTVIKIAEEEPRALSAYFLCLSDSDRSGKAWFSKDYIQNTLARSWTKFKNDIRALSRLLLIRMWLDLDTVRIELVPQEWD